MTLKLASAVTSAHPVTVAYEQPLAGAKLREAAMNEVAAFEAESVAKNTVPPTARRTRCGVQG